MCGNGKRRKEVKIVKRILLVLTVALVMAAMLVVMVAPAFATVRDAGPFKQNTQQHQFVGSTKPGR